MRHIPAITLALALGSALAGIALSWHYLPAPEHAHAAIQWVRDEVPAGTFIHSLHVYASGLLMAVLFAQVIGDALLRRYRGAGRCGWWLGLAALLTALGIGFTGTLLPWTQHAYWDTTVRIGIMGNVPGIGPQLRALAQGGDAIGMLTLIRFFTLHTQLLGPILLALLFWRVRLEQWDSRSSLTTHLVAAMSVLIAVLLSVLHPAYFGPIADPLTTTYEARPEWWFLPLFQLRKLVAGPLETPLLMAIPGLVVAYLAALPLIDTGDLKREKLTGIISKICLIGFLVLLGLGALDKPDELAAPPPDLIAPVAIDQPGEITPLD